MKPRDQARDDVRRHVLAAPSTFRQGGRSGARRYHKNSLDGPRFPAWVFEEGFVSRIPTGDLLPDVEDEIADRALLSDKYYMAGDFSRSIQSRLLDMLVEAGMITQAQAGIASAFASRHRLP